MRVRLSEVVALLAVAEDLAFGQPQESQLRGVVMADELATRLGWTRDHRDTVVWVAMLRYIGCTGHAHEAAALLGDEIEGRARSLLVDQADPVSVLRDILGHPSGHGWARVAAAAAMLVKGKAAAVENFHTGCEVGDALAARLGMTAAVRASLACTFERWNGKGLPAHISGSAIPAPMRLVHVTADLEVLARTLGLDAAVATIGERSARTYDPELAAAVVAAAAELVDAAAAEDPWDAVARRRPSDDHQLAGSALIEALEVVADFVDLKSVHTFGHSRAVAALAADAAGDDDAERARIAGLVHDLGHVGLPNTILDKAGPLTQTERDRVEQHTLVTGQLLRRVPAMAAIAATAAGHHERLDGSGYHRGSRQGSALAAAECYVAMCESRSHRPAREPSDAATELRAMGASGLLDVAGVEAVLAAAGHRARPSEAQYPAGLTAREVDVLRLVAQGLTTRAIAERLVISAKTVDTHIQHIYPKIGCSTRGAAALFAAQHGLAPTLT